MRKDRAASRELGSRVGAAVVDMQGFGQAPPQDRRVEDLLPCAQGLVADPAASDEQATVVVDEHEQAGPHRARSPRVGHEGTDEDVADPALVGGVGLVPPERPPVAQELASCEAAPAELLGEGPLGDPHAVTRPDDLADVGGASCRHFEAQADRLVEQRWVEARAALVRAGLVAQAREAIRSVPADPAIQGVAAHLPGFASG